MKLLITGKSGQLGRALVNELGAGHVVMARARTDLDIGDEAAVRDTVTRIEPDIIINAAAYTAVDRAETEIEKCRTANALGPQYLASAAKDLGAKMVQFSTDYVFDGHSDRPYSEEDTANPLSVYGLSKLDGDRAVLSSGVPALVLRTGWLYSSHGPSFVHAILKKLAAGDTLEVVSDQTGIPTSAEFIARSLSKLLPELSTQSTSSGQILNVACTGSASWYDFAEYCRQLASPHVTGANSIVIKPISSDYYGAAARRPAYSCLSTTALENRFGITPPDWKEEFETVFSRIEF